jgi:hypothetical protein
MSNPAGAVAICFVRGDPMAQGLNSTKTGARPSHEAIEQEAPATEVGKNKEQKMDHAAMQSAKRAQNRIHSNEETTHGNSIFSK